MNEKTIARLYLLDQTADKVVVRIPGTSYQTHLLPTGAVEASPQGRVLGVIRLPVWKLDTVTAGGAFIEPVFGRPRRVQGAVIGAEVQTNSLILDVCGQPVVGDLPARWRAADIRDGSRVGLDIREGAEFEPLCGDAQRELGPGRPQVVNLGIG